VKCREMRKADMGLFSSDGFDTELGSVIPSSGNICYSMEIKDAVLPPWVVSGICSAMSFDARSFDLRYSQSLLPFMHPLQLMLCTIRLPIFFPAELLPSHYPWA
jgi:hypothetical protein